jgi:hypothetical protein
MEESVFDPTYGGSDLTYDGPADTTDWYNGYVSDLEFDQDWADALAGKFTIDEVTSGQDITANADVAAFGSDWSSALANIAKGIGKAAFDKLKSSFTKNGKPDWAAIATAGAGLYQLSQNKDQTGGYNKPVPKMDMVREQVQYNDPNRRPGETGRQYFTDPRFATQGNAQASAGAKAASAEQAAGLRAAYQARPAEAPNPYAGKMNLAYSRPTTPMQPSMQPPIQPAGLPQIPTQLNAQGGLGMAAGGIADAGRYLQGETDGMADKIPSSIDGEQPAALSHGEFVVPADVVSHLGNGNSDAGAKKLYEMMDRIRQARTGTTEQGKEINPDEFTMGGLAAAYASGGSVQGYAGPDGSAVVNPTATAAPAGSAGVPLDTSKTSTLSPWVGDYVTGALGQGAAMAAAPYQAYQGPLTAGTSGLQQQAFAGASEMATAGYQPSQYMGGFGVQQAQQYMNPYLQASLDPQLKELKRQSDIARLEDTTRLTKAGSYGGSRQAIMESEGRRNLMGKQAEMLGTGYKQAYDTAAAQYQKEREAEEASRQFGAGFGMKATQQLADMGAQQRAITGEGVAADKAQFEEQRDFAYKMPQYQLNLLQGLPIGASTSTTDQSGIAGLQSQISGLSSVYKLLENLGQAPATTAPKA